jgi:outer membrane protein TolC
MQGGELAQLVGHGRRSRRWGRSLLAARLLLVQVVDSNRRAFDLSSRLYPGNTDFLDVLNAERSLFASELALVESDRTIATNLVNLYKALGGGWSDDSPTTRPAK